MTSNHFVLKRASVGAIAAGLLAVSGQLGADDVSHLIWAGYFKQAYDSISEQTGSTSVRSGAHSSGKDAIIWAGHFERAYGPSSQRTSVVTGSGRFNAIQRLLWAGHFKQAYQPAGADMVPESGSIEVAMDR